MALAYHHGSVEEAATDAALEIVRTGGTGSLTIRNVALGAGVTHAALYRHFAGRDAVLDRVAARWLAVAAQRVAGTDSFVETIRRYLDWALESEHLYECAFEHRSPEGALAPLALAELADLVADSYRAEHGGTAIDVRDAVFATWGQLHGLIDLYRKQLLRAADDESAATYILGLVTPSIDVTR